MYYIFSPPRFGLRRECRCTARGRVRSSFHFLLRLQVTRIRVTWLPRAGLGGPRKQHTTQNKQCATCNVALPRQPFGRRAARNEQQLATPTPGLQPPGTTQHVTSSTQLRGSALGATSATPSPSTRTNAQRATSRMQRITPFHLIPSSALGALASHQATRHTHATPLPPPDCLLLLLLLRSI